MSWRYIVMREESEDEVWHSIREGHFNRDGLLWGYSESPRPAFGESLTELRAELLLMVRAVERAINRGEVYEDGKVEFAKADWEEEDGR